MLNRRTFLRANRVPSKNNYEVHEHADSEEQGDREATQTRLSQIVGSIRTALALENFQASRPTQQQSTTELAANPDSGSNDASGSASGSSAGSSSGSSSGLVSSLTTGKESALNSGSTDGTGPSGIGGDGGGNGDDGDEYDPYPDRQPPRRRRKNDTARRYLHLIIVDQKYGKKQVPLEITELRSDYEVFERLNEVYREKRGKWRALTKLQKLRLTKVRPTLPTIG